MLLEEGIILDEEDRCIICLNEFNIFIENDKYQRIVKTNCLTSHYYCYSCYSLIFRLLIVIYPHCTEPGLSL